MDLRDYVWMVRAHLLGLFAFVFLGVTAAAGYTLTQPEVYQANASGFVTTGTSSDGVGASVNDSLAKSRAASYVDIATSRAVADLVIENLGLSDDASSLVGRVTVAQPENTVLIKITTTGTTPVDAQQLADAWVAALAERIAQVENPENRDAPGILGLDTIEAAALPSAPISPQPRRNLLAGAIMGLAAGILYSLVRARMDRRLRSPETVEARFRVPILGVIPETKGQTKRGLEISAASTSGRSWGTGEAFRKLRTSLSYMSVDDPPRVIVVTSPKPRDGKSTTAANLAAAIALSGETVTLVDADLRRPTLADSLGLVEGAGLTDVLIGRATLEDVLQDHAELGAQFAVLAAGNIPPNPSELLGSQAMLGLLAELSLRGLVVVDAPPLLPVTDAVILTRHADGAIIVVRHGETLDDELRLSIAALESASAKVLGVVFNGVPIKSTSYGYYGQYGGTQEATTPKPAKSKSRGAGGHRVRR